jgi:hypothetical protein
MGGWWRREAGARQRRGAIRRAGVLGRRGGRGPVCRSAWPCRAAWVMVAGMRCVSLPTCTLPPRNCLAFMQAAPYRLPRPALCAPTSPLRLALSLVSPSRSPPTQYQTPTLEHAYSYLSSPCLLAGGTARPVPRAAGPTADLGARQHDSHYGDFERHARQLQRRRTAHAGERAGPGALLGCALRPLQPFHQKRVRPCGGCCMFGWWGVGAPGSAFLVGYESAAGQAHPAPQWPVACLGRVRARTARAQPNPNGRPRPRRDPRRRWPRRALWCGRGRASSTWAGSARGRGRSGWGLRRRSGVCCL